MAISTLSLCSSLTTQCQISLHHQAPPSLSLLSLSKASFSFAKPKDSSPLLSARPTFSHVCKFSESEAAVAEADPEEKDEVDSESFQIVEASPVEETPKREEVFAVVMVGGRQYIVFPGRFIYTQRLKGAQVNDKEFLVVGTE